LVVNRFDGDDEGISIRSSVRDVVAGNRFSHLQGGAISVDDSSRIGITHNRIADSGDGILAGGSHDLLVRRNVVTGTGLFGNPETGGFGLLFDAADNTTVKANHFLDGRGPAIFVITLDKPGTSDGNVIRRNVASSRLYDAIAVNGGATGTLLDRNLAISSGDDGIDVDAPRQSSKTTSRRATPISESKR